MSLIYIPINYFDKNERFFLLTHVYQGAELLFHYNGKECRFKTPETVYQVSKIASMCSDIQKGQIAKQGYKELTDGSINPSSLGEIAVKYEKTLFPQGYNSAFSPKTLWKNNTGSTNQIFVGTPPHNYYADETLRERLFFEINLVKYTQDLRALALLFLLFEKYPNAFPVEDTEPHNILPGRAQKDSFWGNANNGRNASGSILRRVYFLLFEEYQAGLTDDSKGIEIRSGLSNKVAKALNFTSHQENTQLAGKRIPSLLIKKEMDKMRNGKDIFMYDPNDASAKRNLLLEFTHKQNEKEKIETPNQPQQNNLAYTKPPFFDKSGIVSKANLAIQNSREAIAGTISRLSLYSTKAPRVIIGKGNINDSFKFAFSDCKAAKEFFIYLQKTPELEKHVTFWNEQERYPMISNGVNYRYIVRIDGHNNPNALAQAKKYLTETHKVDPTVFDLATKYSTFELDPTSHPIQSKNLMSGLNLMSR